MATTEFSTVSTATPTWVRYLAYARFALAWLITMGVLIYSWGRTLIFGRMIGSPDPRFVALLIVGVIAVMLLSFHLASQLPWRSRWLPFLLVVVPWVGIAGTLIALYTGPNMPWPIVAALFIPATLWVPWTGWLFYRPLSWSVRLSVLALLLVAMSGFWLLKMHTMAGEGKPNYAWFWEKQTQSFGEVNSDNAAAIDLAKTTPNDYPQFLGPNRDGIVPNARLAVDWEKTLPKEVWRTTVGAGWGAFAVVGDYAITQGQGDKDKGLGHKEYVVCYRVSDGEIVWMHEDDARLENSLGGTGPRATPTIHEGKVYAIGGTGLLNCLDGATGKRVWSVDILKDNDAGTINHGVCGSPLIVDNRVLVCPTGDNGISLVAYDRETGERLWQGRSDQASYGSPMLTKLLGIPQVLLYTGEGVAVHDPATGALLWKFTWTNAERTNCSQPIVLDGAAGRVLVATGYGKGSVLLQVSRPSQSLWEVEPVWKSFAMKAKFATPVLYQNYVYGLDDGILACQDPTTGKLKWKAGRYKHGQLLLAGDLLLVQAENGEVVLVKPEPNKLVELVHIPALKGTTWNNLALSGKYLLVRNDHEAVCYELPMKE